MLVSGTATAAVLTKAALDEFLVFLRRVGIAEVRIYGQSAIQMVTEEKTVDLVLRDEHFTLAQEIGLDVKVPLRILQAIENSTDAVGVITTDTETHDVRGRGVGVKEGMIFLCQRLQTTLSFCERHHILVQFRVALVLVVDRQSLRE